LLTSPWLRLQRKSDGIGVPAKNLAIGSESGFMTGALIEDGRGEM